MRKRLLVMKDNWRTLLLIFVAMVVVLILAAVFRGLRVGLFLVLGTALVCLGISGLLWYWFSLFGFIKVYQELIDGIPVLQYVPKSLILSLVVLILGLAVTTAGFRERLAFRIPPLSLLRATPVPTQLYSDSTSSTLSALNEQQESILPLPQATVVNRALAKTRLKILQDTNEVIHTEATVTIKALAPPEPPTVLSTETRLVIAGISSELELGNNYLLIINLGSATTLSGWRLVEIPQGEEFRFPAVEIAERGALAVAIGGPSTLADKLFWELDLSPQLADSEIWLVAPSNVVVDRFKYTFTSTD